MMATITEGQRIVGAATLFCHGATLMAAATVGLTEVAGMVAENEACQIKGESPTHPESDFTKMAGQLHGIMEAISDSVAAMQGRLEEQFGKAE
jgi:hypothetical protein